MNRKAYLKDPWADVPPTPFTRWDYVLCIVAFGLIAVASLPQVAALIARGI
jgi:hypothetical protein